ncbi:hypothetical protein D9757_008975 [Collybiopsis confluens]|uniref:Uncharacterized protein n=1 Tax=Collybiopsis confluens TaxID=2823264 RepID=A0A8H5H2K2_9AGAR|nr:hypothetical protein D9757_008975 [Collybiopsis confluens]
MQSSRPIKAAQKNPHYRLKAFSAVSLRRSQCDFFSLRRHIWNRPLIQCFSALTINRLPTTRIIVTSNAEQYRVVEITGAPNGSYIRERILSKMCVPDNSYSRYSIYQSEIGAYALGGALNDASLFELCLQYGDPSGSLRFFVSTAPNRPPTRIEPEYPPDNNYHSSRRYRRA